MALTRNFSGLAAFVVVLMVETVSATNETPKTKPTQGISHEKKWLLTKIHGITFVFAWFLFVPVAVGIARYFRDCLTQYTPMGIRLWYHAHRTFNIIAAALMVVGLVTIFIAHEWRWLGPKVGGGSHNTSATAYHTIFGLLSVLLAWIQPLNSLLRCGPQHRLRPLFNWAHRSVGVVSFLFASAAIFIACVYFYKHLTSSRNAVIFACLCVGFIVGCAILLEIIAWKARSKKQFLLPEDPEAEKHFDSSADPDYHYLTQGVIFSIVTAALIGFCSALSAIIAQKD